MKENFEINQVIKLMLAVLAENRDRPLNSFEIKKELEISSRSWEEILKKIKRDIPCKKVGNQYVFYL